VGLTSLKVARILRGRVGRFWFVEIRTYLGLGRWLAIAVSCSSESLLDTVLCFSFVRTFCTTSSGVSVVPASAGTFIALAAALSALPSIP